MRSHVCHACATLSRLVVYAGKGGAAHRATATRGIVGRSGKMKYFNGKSSSSSAHTPPEAPSAIDPGAPPQPLDASGPDLPVASQRRMTVVRTCHIATLTLCQRW